MKKTERSNSFPSWRYFTFACGDLGYQLIYYWVTAYLMIFYTDVFAIPATAVSVLMLVVRLYDAINDPILGSLMDRGKSKRGRYRPWILIGGIGLAVSSCFMFWAHPQWSSGGKIVYMYITYIVVVTFSTLFYMAQGALNGCISPDSMVRARASSMRFMMTNLGAVIIGCISPLVLAHFADNMTKGYLLCLIVCGVVSIPLFTVAFRGSEEVIYPKDNQPKISMKRQFGTLLHNRNMVIVVFCMFVYGFQFTMRMSAATYYFTYVAGNFALFATFGTVTSGFGILGALAAPYFYKFLKHKGKAASLVMFFTAAVMLIQYFAPAPRFSFFVLTALAGFSFGAYPSLIYSMVPDVTDYAELVNNVRIDGFLNAIASFGFKAGGAIAASLIGVLLAAVGYQSGGAQPGEAMTLMNGMLTLIPAIIAVVAAVLLLFYNLSDEKHDEILKKLQEK